MVEYAGVQQRGVLLTSVHALRRAAKTVTRQRRQDSARETPAVNALCQQRFAGAADAQQALEVFCQGLAVIQLEDAAVQPLYGHRRRGRPAQGAQPPRVGYRLSGAPATPWDSRLPQRWQQSSFILATHELDSNQLSDRQLLQTAKAQQRVERGFRFLKDPPFPASQF